MTRHHRPSSSYRSPLRVLAGLGLVASAILLPAHGRAAASSPAAAGGTGGAPSAAWREPEASSPDGAADKGAGGQPSAVVDADPRPIIRLRVKNEFKPEDTIFPQVMEGRLISDLADMETFRTVADDRDGAFLLTCVIRDLTVTTGEYYRTSRDADSGGTPSVQNQVTVSMDLELHLEDTTGTEVYTGKLNSQASRDLEISLETTIQFMRQELVDRAAQRLEKILRKRLKKLRAAARPHPPSPPSG